MENLEEKAENSDYSIGPEKSKNLSGPNDIKGNHITIEDAKAALTQNFDLIQGAINGESKAFNELYVQSYRYVFFVVRQYIPDDETTYDAIQETFIKVYKNISGLREPAAYYGWLTSIAKNTAIDILRTKPSETELVYEENNDNTVKDEQTNSDVSLDIETVLKEMDPAEAELLSLVYYDGMRISQIAKIQGVPATTVYSRFNKAKKNLKAQLNVHGIDKAIYSGNFVAMITTAIRNVIGTALLSFAIAQQILDSITGKGEKKELAIANIIKNHQKKIALKIASIIVLISMLTTIFTFVLLKVVDKDFNKGSQITVGSDNTSEQDVSSDKTTYGESSTEQNAGSIDELLNEVSSIVPNNKDENELQENREEITSGNESFRPNNTTTDSDKNESIPSVENDSDIIQTPDVFGNSANNVMWFYGDSFSPIGCPIAKNSKNIYYTDSENIFSVNVDGSKKTTIYSSKESTPLCYDLNLVGDYLYFVDGGIKRIKTDGSDVETLYSGDAFNLIVRGDKAWFVVLDSIGNRAMYTKYDLFQIDLQTRETTKLIDAASGLGLKIVLQDKLIYVNGDTVYQKNLLTGVDETLYKIENSANSYYIGFENMCINGDEIYLLEKNLSYNLRKTSIIQINLNSPNKIQIHDQAKECPIYDMYGYINGHGLLIAYESFSGAKNALITRDGVNDCEIGMNKVFMFEGDNYIYTYDTEQGIIQRMMPDGSHKQTF